MSAEMWLDKSQRDVLRWVHDLAATRHLESATEYAHADRKAPTGLILIMRWDEWSFEELDLLARAGCHTKNIRNWVICYDCGRAVARRSAYWFSDHGENQLVALCPECGMRSDR